MTPALIINVILAAVVLAAVVGLLAHSIHAERGAAPADA
jgi:hypothetical protein